MGKGFSLMRLGSTIVLALAVCQSAAAQAPVETKDGSAIAIDPAKPTPDSANTEVDIDLDPEVVMPEKGMSLAAPTLGGLQFWSDVQLFRDWRIQQNALTGHFRLLDGSGRRHAWGGEQKCLAKLQAIREAKGLQPLGGKAVLLLHGITRTRHSLSGIGDRLQREGYVPYHVSYASTRQTIEEHADHLHQIVRGLMDAEEIHFVCHSMGGLVVRAYLAKYQDPRVKRLVMMGTPNLGAEKADIWAENFAYKIVMGPAGQQLVTGETGVAMALPPTVGIEVGIIAGGKLDGQGYSRRLPGDDDGTVTVESTRLPGARDFVLVRARHTFMMNSPVIHDYAASFLTHGYFRSEAEREPIPLPEAAIGADEQKAPAPSGGSIP